MKGTTEPVFYKSDKLNISFDFNDDSLLFEFLMSGYYPVIPYIVVISSIIFGYFMIKLLIFRLKQKPIEIHKNPYLYLWMVLFFVSITAEVYIKQSEEMAAIKKFAKIYNSTL
jgi:hypothetical protein